VIPDEAVEEVARHLAFYTDRPGTDWTVEARAILEAAAPHLVAQYEAKLAAITALLDKFDAVTKWMETSDETGGHADEAVSQIRDILEATK
jgi:hypothetical protein